MEEIRTSGSTRVFLFGSFYLLHLIQNIFKTPRNVASKIKHLNLSIEQKEKKRLYKKVCENVEWGVWYCVVNS